MSDIQSYSSDNPFATLYTNIYDTNTSGQGSLSSQNMMPGQGEGGLPHQNIIGQTMPRTPSIPYNYMPRQNYTSSPGKLQSYTSNPNLTIYNNDNFEKPVDLNFNNTFFDFSNPNTQGMSFIPSPSKSTVIG